MKAVWISRKRYSINGDKNHFCTRLYCLDGFEILICRRNKYMFDIMCDLLKWVSARKNTKLVVFISYLFLFKNYATCQNEVWYFSTYIRQTAGTYDSLCLENERYY